MSEQSEHTTPTRTVYRVVDYDTGEALAGEPTQDLIDQSAAVSDGAVLATLIVGMWYYVPASDADRMRVYEKAEVRTVYVEDVRGPESAYDSERGGER